MELTVFHIFPRRSIATSSPNSSPWHQAIGRWCLPRKSWAYHQQCKNISSSSSSSSNHRIIVESSSWSCYYVHFCCLCMHTEIQHKRSRRRGSENEKIVRKCFSAHWRAEQRAESCDLHSTVVILTAHREMAPQPLDHFDCQMPYLQGCSRWDWMDGEVFLAIATLELTLEYKECNAHSQCRDV